MAVSPLLEQSAVCLPELHLHLHMEGQEERKSAEAAATTSRRRAIMACPAMADTCGERGGRGGAES